MILLLAAVAAVLLAVIVVVLRPILGLEKPAYTLESREGALDIRRYEPVTVATTTLSGRYRESSRAGFRTIARYIFGGNEASESIAMTAPVLIENPAAPTYSMAFVMPAAAVASGLPTPSDAALSLQPQAWGRVAVWSFGGWATEERIGQEWEAMRAALTVRGVQAERFDWVAQYSPPSMPPPLRHNELWVVLDPAP